MGSSIVLDTNFVSSIFNRNDVNHVEAIKILSKSEVNTNVIIPDVVMLELCLFSVNNHIEKDLDILNFAGSLKTRHFKLNSRHIHEFQVFIAKTKLNIKMVDYFVAFTAIYNKATLITFDKKLSKTFAKITC